MRSDDNGHGGGLAAIIRRANLDGLWRRPVADRRSSCLRGESKTGLICVICGSNLVFIPVRLRSGQAVLIRGFSSLVAAKGRAGLIRVQEIDSR